MFNKKLNVLVQDSNDLCNINSNLSVTGELGAENLEVSSTSSLEGNVSISSLNANGIGTLQGSLSASGLSNLGSSIICNGNINGQNSSITGLSSPENGLDAVNYSFYLTYRQQDVFQYISSQYNSIYSWSQDSFMDWQALKENTYETEDASKMIKIQSINLQILLPGTYQISIDLNKADGYGNPGGQMNLVVYIGESSSVIATGNNYTQFVDFFGNASICNSLGGMFSVTEKDIQNKVYLRLQSFAENTGITYFNYRIIRYAFL